MRVGWGVEAHLQGDGVEWVVPRRLQIFLKKKRRMGVRWPNCSASFRKGFSFLPPSRPPFHSFFFPFLCSFVFRSLYLSFSFTLAFLFVTDMYTGWGRSRLTVVSMDKPTFAPPYTYVIVDEVRISEEAKTLERGKASREGSA